jgi:hypothetical protein
MCLHLNPVFDLRAVSFTPSKAQVLFWGTGVPVKHNINTLIICIRPLALTFNVADPTRMHRHLLSRKISLYVVRIAIAKPLGYTIVEHRNPLEIEYAEGIMGIHDGEQGLRQSRIIY